MAPRFGLRRRRLREPVDPDNPLFRSALPEQRPNGARVARRMALLVPAVVVLGLANGQLALSAATYDNAGVPAIARYPVAPGLGAGWKVERWREITWARAYFGSDSRWLRYRLSRQAEVGAGYGHIWADSITTSSLNALRAFPVRECYDFHEFELYLYRHVLVGGVKAELFGYRDATRRLWHTLSWEWPVRGERGRIQHERMTLFLLSRAKPSSTPGLLPSGGGRGRLEAALVAGLNRFEPQDDQSPAVSHALLGLAGRMIALRIAAGAR